MRWGSMCGFHPANTSGDNDEEEYDGLDLRQQVV